MSLFFFGRINPFETRISIMGQACKNFPPEFGKINKIL